MSAIRKAYGDYAFIIFILLAGITGTLRSAWLYQQSVEREVAENFRSVARDRIELIKDALETNETVMNSLAAFYRASANVSATEFDIFVTQALKDHEYIQAVDWIPRVTEQQRAEYESAAQAWSPGYAFKDKVGDHFETAKVRDEYLPIYYTNRENAMLLGFDFAGDPVRGGLLKQAQTRGVVTVSPGVRLLADPAGQRRGVLFVMPVYQDTQMSGTRDTRRMFSGYVVSVVPMAGIIDAALQKLKYEGTNILIHDLTANRDNALLYARSTRLKSIPESEILEDYLQGRSGESAVLDVGGRKWEIMIQPARGFFAPSVQRETWFIAVTGSLLTLLLVFYMQRRLRENERISREVEQRTRELSQSKRQTEMILLSTNDGIIGLDDKGAISFANPRTLGILGYGRAEMIGREHHGLLHRAHDDGRVFEAHECPINNALADRMPVTVSDEVFWKKDGNALPVEYTASPIIDEDKLTGAVVVFRDITERRRTDAQLQQMARFDQLTGLANRTMLMENLTIAMAQAATSKKVVSLIYMDLDNFKPVNDTLGHEAGDAYLKAFAGLLRSVVRKEDVAARLGGDEFTILLSGLSSPDEAVALVERLLQKMEEPVLVAGRHFRIAASIGIASCPKDSHDAETLLRHADVAMYKSKKDKTKGYVIYES